MSTDGRSVVGEWLTSHYGTGTPVFADRASALLYAYLVALGRPGDAVVVPSTTCHAVAYAVDLAGYELVFADVDPADYNMTAGTFVAAVERSAAPVAACVAIHSFGHLADVAAIDAACRERGIAVVEDAAPIMGAGDEGRHGDAALVSFGYSKPLDAGAGGALLVRDTTMAAKAQTVVAEAQAAGHASADDAAAFVRDYYAIRARAREDATVRGEIAGLARRHRQFSLVGTTTADWAKAAALLPALPDVIAARRSRAARLDDALDGLPLHRPVRRPGSAPWRYSLLVDDADGRDGLVEAIRAEAGHASTWYPSLAADFGRPPDETPVAARIERTVVNLWLTEGVDDCYVEAVSALVRARLGG